MSEVSEFRSLRESGGEADRLGFLRDEIVGADSTFLTPFGERLMVYSDYTASGRSLLFVENYLQSLQRIYANTHTEDDTTGRNMTQLLHEAEAVIKAEVNAGPDGCLIAVGTGATGAINKLQQILGVYTPPATRARLLEEADAFFGIGQRQAFEAHLREHQPVVFVGPYEHHSNEISWRLGLASVVEVGLDAEGGIDLAHLETLLQAPEYQGRLRIGAFSAASNVTGIRTPVHRVARLLHRHGAIACFDFAASAPYVSIDMNPPVDADGDPSLDAIFISAHKFLGGPGASGVLVFNRRLYRTDLPPTVAAGGTVDYVSEWGQDFVADIEEREKPGTPGTLQVLKAALAFEVKRWVTPERIEAREAELVGRAMMRWAAVPTIEILGNPDPDRRIAIISFNVHLGEGVHLHPKFVTALLNDLFGIQSRAGCSCAGPYGHRLLDIDAERSSQYRQVVHEGHCGMKPGWCRVGFHYTMDDAEADYIIEAVEFVGRFGARFLPLYEFDLHTGTWTHRHAKPSCPRLTIDAALAAPRVERTARPASERQSIYRRYLDEAHRAAETLGVDHPRVTLAGDLADLQFFALADAPGDR